MLDYLVVGTKVDKGIITVRCEREKTDITCFCDSVLVPSSCKDVVRLTSTCTSSFPHEGTEVSNTHTTTMQSVDESLAYEVTATHTVDTATYSHKLVRMAHTLRHRGRVGHVHTISALTVAPKGAKDGLVHATLTFDARTKVPCDFCHQGVTLTAKMTECMAMSGSSKVAHESATASIAAETKHYVVGASAMTTGTIAARAQMRKVGKHAATVSVDTEMGAGRGYKMAVRCEALSVDGRHRMGAEAQVADGKKPVYTVFSDLEITKNVTLVARMADLQKSARPELGVVLKY